MNVKSIGIAPVVSLLIVACGAQRANGPDGPTYPSVAVATTDVKGAEDAIALSSIGAAKVTGLAFPVSGVAAQVRMFPPERGASTPSAHLEIVLSNEHDLCAPTKLHPGTSELALIVVQESSVTPGTYTVPQPKNYGPRYGLARMFAFDGTCNVRSKLKSLGGSVTIERIDPNVVSGSFEMVLSSGTVKGSFTAPICLPRDWQTLCPITECANGARVDEQTCTEDGHGTAAGEFFTYCKKDDVGHVTSGSTRCSASRSAPKCVAEIVDGRSHAACCPADRTRPSDPGCVATPSVWWR
jgi:hypothetical protein